MKTISLPEYLLSPERLDTLITLVLEKDQAIREIKARDFGPRVTDPETARHLLSRISGCARSVLGLTGGEMAEPEISLNHNLSRLPRQTLKAYLFFLPLCLVLAVVTATQGSGTPLTYVVFSMLVLLLLIPALVHRRTRLHLEHQCQYVRTEDGKATIFVDELHSAPFQSYLAHEYAHHLRFFLKGDQEEAWIKEGWARLVQWHVVKTLSENEGNPAFLVHALFQIVSELKFACTLLARVHHRRLPRKVRRIRTLYHLNPLYNLVTGTPGFHLGRLLEHAVGTAVIFLQCRERGCEKVLSDPASFHA